MDIKDLVIIHHCNAAQIDHLRQAFTFPKQKIFDWPTANPKEFIQETMEWVTPDWIEVMSKFIQE